MNLTFDPNRLILSVYKYLDNFSKALAKEVRQLLTEVNDLVENKTRLQLYVFLPICIVDVGSPSVQ